MIIMTSANRRNHRLTTVILAIGLLLGGCGDTSTPAEHISAAQSYLDKGEINAAVIELKNALQKDGKNAKARWLLGSTYLRLGNGPAAAKELQRAKAEGYASPALDLALLKTWLMLGKYQKVLDESAKIPGFMDSAEILSLRAAALLGLDRSGEARTAYDHALGSPQHSLESKLNLARMALAFQDTDEALKQVKAAISEAPNDPRAWLIKAGIELRKKDTAGAESSYRKVLELVGHSPIAEIGLIRTLLAKGDLEAATKRVAQAEKTYPKVLAIKYLAGYIAYQHHDLEQAKLKLREVLASIPDHPYSLLLLGNILYSQGKLEQSQELISKFHERFPGHLPAGKLLAAIDIKLNQNADAIKLLESLRGKYAKDAQLLALLGSAYLKDGQTDRGTRLLEKAARLNPDAAALRTQLAVGRLAAGQTSEAIADLESALKLDPQMLRADILLILSRLQQQDFDGVIEAASQLSAKRPKSPVPYNYLGAAYLGKQDVDKAREQFEKAIALNPKYTPALLNLAGMERTLGHKEAAKKGFEGVLKIQKDNPQALVALAEMAAADNDTGKTLELLERARVGNPTSLQPRLLLARYYLHNQDSANALALTKEAVDLNLRSAEALKLRGQALLVAGKYQDAAEVYRTLMKYHPGLADGPYNLAILDIRQGKKSEARKLLEGILQRHKNHLLALSALAKLDFAEGHEDKALAGVAYIREIAPKRPDGDVLMAQFKLAQKKPDEAAVAFRQALKKAPSSTLVISLYQALMRASKKEAAVAALQNWLATHADDMRVRLVLANHYQVHEQNPQAITEYQRVLKTLPDNALALNNLAWLYFKTGNDQALKLAEQAHKQVPESPQVSDTLAWIQLQNGQADKAVKLLKETARKAPKNPDIAYHYAVALERTGKQGEARALLQKVLGDKQGFENRPQAEALLQKLGG